MPRSDQEGSSMDAGLAGSTVLVTGASGGIGLACARAFAAEGASLALHYHRQRAVLEQVVDDLAVPTALVGGDLTDEGAVEAMYSETLDAFGRIDVVVVNHGIWNPRATALHEMSLEQWRETLDVDLTSAFLVCRAFLRHLDASPREAASLVLVGSTAALFGEADHADYSAAKAGMTHGLTLSLKNEIVRLAPRGRVNCVCPGWTDTPMAAGHADDPAAVSWATATMPLAKIATPEDVAGAVVFLASDRLAGHISGAMLPVAGGMEGRRLR
jgi:3-oxoacyl-[acyl-carrier protein] reductase